MNESLKLFSQEVADEIQKRFPEREVILRTVTKNNGVILSGIQIRMKDETISPCLYLDKFFEKYDGIVDDEVIESIISVYDSTRLSGPDLSFLRDYENVKENIRAKLINAAMNEELLKEVPHINFMDLAVVPYYQFVEDIPVFGGNASFTITSKLMEIWGVTADQIISAAVNNTLSSIPVSIDPMISFLKEMNPEVSLPDEEDIPMYIAKADCYFGSVAMLYQDVLTDFAKKVGSDLYIIPSSTMELIIVPVNKGIPEAVLSGMVKDVNTSALDTVDILSDHVYYYSMDSGYRF